MRVLRLKMQMNRVAAELPLPRLPTLSGAANRERSCDDIHIVGRVRASASSAMRAPSPARRDLSRGERCKSNLIQNGSRR